MLFLGAAELLIRFCIYLRCGAPGKSYGIYMFDKQLGAVHRPNSYNLKCVINNWGFKNINNISEHKPKGALRIYCSGGSTTFCYNLSTEESWPNLLQDKLKQIPGHENDEVLNAGEICFGASQEFVLARRFVPKLKPDIVILYGAGINEQLAADALKNEGKDIDLLLKRNQWGVFSAKIDQARFLKRNSVLVKAFDHYIKNRLIKKFVKVCRKPSTKSAKIHPWVMANFEYTLREYINFLQDNDCKIILVRYADNGIEDWYVTNYIRVFREQAVKIAQEEGIIVYDFVPIVEQHPYRKGLYIDTGVHLTQQGAVLLADELLKVVLKYAN